MKLWSLCDPLIWNPTVKSPNMTNILFFLSQSIRKHPTFKPKKFNQLPIGGWPNSFKALNFKIKSDLINFLN